MGTVAHLRASPVLLLARLWASHCRRYGSGRTVRISVWQTEKRARELEEYHFYRVLGWWSLRP